MHLLSLFLNVVFAFSLAPIAALAADASSSMRVHCDRLGCNPREIHAYPDQYVLVFNTSMDSENFATSTNGFSIMMLCPSSQSGFGNKTNRIQLTKGRSTIGAYLVRTEAVDCSRYRDLLAGASNEAPVTLVLRNMNPLLSESNEKNALKYLGYLEEISW